MAISSDKTAGFSRRWEWLVALALVGIVLILRLGWPGDTQWINDEPLFLAKADAMNRGGPLTAEGLRGTTGLTYGPMAVWLYAGLMRLTSGLLELVVLRTALFGLGVTAGLFWLAAVSRRLRPLWVVPLLLSPYAWLYARQLWDNTWLIPLGTIAIAAYAAFNQRRTMWMLWLAVLTLAAAALIHPMVAPLIIAVTLHALRFHRSWLRTHIKMLVALGLVVLVLSIPWLAALFHHLLASAPPPPPPPLVLPPAEPPQPFYASLVFGLLGGRVLSAQGFAYFIEQTWFAGARWGRPLVFFTFVCHALVWVGVLLTVRRIRAPRGNRFAADGRAPVDVDWHLDWIFLVALIAQWVMLAVLRRNTHPHYYNGAWICYAYFLWTALSAPLGARWLGWLQGLVGVGLAGALAVLTAQLAIHIHDDGGNHSIHLGASLQNQLAVAQELGRYHPDSPLRIEVKNLQMFPHALPILRRLSGTQGDPTGPRLPLCVRYRDAKGTSGFITVVVNCP